MHDCCLIVQLCTKFGSNISYNRCEQPTLFLTFDLWLQAITIPFLFESPGHLRILRILVLCVCIPNFVQISYLYRYVILRYSYSPSILRNSRMSCSLSAILDLLRGVVGHRGHNFALPTIHLEFNKRHFVARVLFDYVWCVSHVRFKIGAYYLRPIFNSF